MFFDGCHVTTRVRGFLRQELWAELQKEGLLGGPKSIAAFLFAPVRIEDIYTDVLVRF